MIVVREDSYVILGRSSPYILEQYKLVQMHGSTTFRNYLMWTVGAEVVAPVFMQPHHPVYGNTTGVRFEQGYLIQWSNRLKRTQFVLENNVIDTSGIYWCFI